MNISIDQLHPLVLNVGLAIHNGDWNWKNVISPFMRIYYVTSGEAQIILPSCKVTLKPDYLYFIPAFTKHTYVCNSNFSHYYIHIYEDNQGTISLFENLEFPIEIKANELDLLIIKELCDINPLMKLPQSDPSSYDNNPTLMENILKNRRRDLFKKIESRGIIYILLSRFIEHAKYNNQSKDERIVKIINYIHTHIYENIEIEKLAEMIYLSKDHFIRLFKQETGNTPLKYINQKKIEKAQLILVTEDISVKNVAYKLSFEDYSYFNRVFKKITGITPKEYKNTIR